MDRQLYPDSKSGSGSDHVLTVYFLEVGGATPAKADFESLHNRVQVLAALKAIDSMLAQNRPVPKSKMESFEVEGIKIYEIKAPAHGRRISRLFMYRESDWDMFLLFAGEKKSQELPPSWKRTACNRVKNALKERNGEAL